MDTTIRKMEIEDWSEVLEIYVQGIQTDRSTFNIACPTYAEWDAAHVKSCRFVAEADGEIVGWAALTPFSTRECYKGVAEDSIYVSEGYGGKGIGEELLTTLLRESEAQDFWTVQAHIIQKNEASLKLHRKCGFREVGYRERIAKDRFGVWQNTVLMEHRIQKDIAGGCDCAMVKDMEKEQEEEAQRTLGFVPRIKRI